MDIFDTCVQINDFFESNREADGRNALIQLLDFMEREAIPYSELVNRMIRRSGLYPYLKTATANWQDRYAYEAFKVDVGLNEPVTLHREQSSVLRKLLEGENLAVSAPTSFGKSFIIDAYISIKKPKNVLIIVPTLALTDETRRRLQQKFSDRYRIITTSDVELGERNILVFPQERAIGYADAVEAVDLLVIDEFYKASPKFDRERSPALLRAILKLGERAKQKYFLAPNISALKESLFTKGMEFLSVNFNTVFLEKHELYKELGRNEELKSKFLLQLLAATDAKTLVYAATYSNISALSNLFIDELPVLNNERLRFFENWLSKNYSKNWYLTHLVRRGVGVHNGQLHRSLSQIQIRLFEEQTGLNTLISTSSIIEGVNTSAQNVVVWSNKKGGRGNPKLDDFTYKNIIGRGGRMFRHFIGQIYLLEEPPASSATQLELSFTDELLGSIDEEKYSQELTKEQIAKVVAYKSEMRVMLGEGGLAELIDGNTLQTSDSDLIKEIAFSIYKNPSEWNGLGYLNSENPEDWSRLLYKLIRLRPDVWGVEYRKVVGFVKIISGNWTRTIPELVAELNEIDVGIEDFFKLERAITHNLASLVGDLNILYKKITQSDVDVSSFAAKISFAFLPPNVFRLEEYGLPRMISRKIYHAGLVDVVSEHHTLHECIGKFLELGVEAIKAKTAGLDEFDDYVIDYFFDGIQRAG
ncbi:DEAD/DEAH box helicase [Paraburkholderia caribensis]|uniref:DEAD/DEAH box helicase n=1 Tax=Paraburkholderia caribensis TaxID=75105 RepID=UPI001CAE2B62|nr:DEAD/DEAH box helicase [Paraburkholderia caribensis]CAG9239495.1 DEAD/DEAH box helicase [Paraburkholderia caribensis]